jgi:tetratricopeptide (TPR) repeat protein
MQSEWRETIIKEYPFPAASYYNKIRMEETKFKKGKSTWQRMFFSVIDCCEVLLKFLAAAALMEYLKVRNFTPALNRMVAEKLAKKMSMGDWQELLREILRVRGQNGNPFLDALDEAYFVKKGSRKIPTRVQKCADEIICLRNRYKGHSYNVPESDYQALYEEADGLLAEILTGCAFLAEFDYLAVRETEEDGRRVSAGSDMNGSRMSDDYTARILEEPVNEGDFLILTRGEGKLVMDLTPFSYLNIEYENDEEYYCLYEENRNAGGVAEAISYLGILPDSKFIRYRAEEKDDDNRYLVEIFNRLLRPFFEESQTGKVREEIRGKKRFEDCYIGVQQGILDYYTKCFIGREDVLEQIGRWMDENSQGSFYLEGAPGQGKTALMCRLIRDRDAIHHLAARAGGRDDGDGMLVSLLAQIHRKLGREEFCLPEEAAQRQVAFGNALTELSNRCRKNGEKALIVIDALDELPGRQMRQKLSALPEIMPEGIFLVVSARPFSAEPFPDMEVCRLRALTAEERQAIIQAKCPEISFAAAKRIQEISEGNPLFLVCLTERYQRAGGREAESLPPTLEALFGRLMEELYREGNERARDIFGVLAVSPEGHTIRGLGHILGVSPAGVKEEIDRYRLYFVREEKRYRLFHLKLVEYISETGELALEPEEIRSYHEKIIRYCEPAEEKGYQYAFENLAYHYYEAGQPEKVAELPERSVRFRPSVRKLFVRIGKDYEKAETGRGAALLGCFRKREDAETGFSLLTEALEELYASACYAWLLRVSQEYGEDGGVPAKYRRALLRLRAGALGALGRLPEALQVYCLLGREIPEIAQVMEEAAEELPEIFRTGKSGRAANDESGAELSGQEKMRTILGMAKCCREYAMPETALALCRIVRERFCLEDHPASYLKALMNIGDIYYVRARFGEAETVLQEGIALADRIGERLASADIRRIWGQIYYVKGEYEESIRIYEEAKAIFEEEHSETGLGKIYNSLAFSQVYRDPGQAEALIEKAVYYNEKTHSVLELGKSREAKGMACRELAKRQEDASARERLLAQAMVCFDEALSVFRKIGYRSGEGQTLHEAAKTLLEQGRGEEAVRTAEASNRAFVRRGKNSYPIYQERNQRLIDNAEKGNV